MTNILLTGILLSLLALFALLCLAFIAVRRSILAFHAFVAPGQDGTESPVAQIWSLAVKRLVMEFKASLMGARSGEVRGEQAVMGAIVEDTVNAASPLLAAGLSAFPSLRKTLAKNPGLLEFALSKLTTPHAVREVDQSNGKSESGGFAARGGTYGY